MSCTYTFALISCKDGIVPDVYQARDIGRVYMEIFQNWMTYPFADEDPFHLPASWQQVPDWLQEHGYSIVQTELKVLGEEPILGSRRATIDIETLTIEGVEEQPNLLEWCPRLVTGETVEEMALDACAVIMAEIKDSVPESGSFRFAMYEQVDDYVNHIVCSVQYGENFHLEHVEVRMSEELDGAGPEDSSEDAPTKAPNWADEDSDDDEEKQLPPPPRKPLTAFFHFAMVYRPLIKHANPTFGVPEIGRELGKMWREASGAVKREYSDVAARDKARYLEEMARS